VNLKLGEADSRQNGQQETEAEAQTCGGFLHKADPLSLFQTNECNLSFVGSNWQ
jgi:hypothetical protein